MHITMKLAPNSAFSPVYGMKEFLILASQVISVWWCYAKTISEYGVVH